MKLALVSWSYDDVRGISRCVSELVRRFCHEHEVHVFATESELEPPAGVTVHELGLRITRRHAQDWDFFIRAGLRLRKESFDLVHLHFPVWCRGDVFTCHGVVQSALETFRGLPAEQRIALNPRRRMLYQTQIPLYSYHLRRRDTLISAVSNKVKGELAQYYGRNSDEVTLLANGVDIERFHPDRARTHREGVRAELGIGDDRFVLLFVANHFRHKGGRYVLELTRALADRALLLVVGLDLGSAVDEFGPAIAELEEQGRIRLAGRQEEIWRHYGAADALVFPSFYESFGLVVLEAMASGLPVITCSNVAAGAELLVDGDTGFVVDKPWDVEGMTQRAQRLMDDPGLGRSMAQKARKVAEAHSWDVYAAETKKLYDRVFRSQQMKTATQHSR